MCILWHDQIKTLLTQLVVKEVIKFMAPSYLGD